MGFYFWNTCCIFKSESQSWIWTPLQNFASKLFLFSSTIFLFWMSLCLQAFLSQQSQPQGYFQLFTIINHTAVHIVTISQTQISKKGLAEANDMHSCNTSHPIAILRAVPVCIPTIIIWGPWLPPTTNTWGCHSFGFQQIWWGQQCLAVVSTCIFLITI